MQIFLAVTMATLAPLLIIAAGEGIYMRGHRSGMKIWMRVGNSLGWIGGGLCLLYMLCGGLAIALLVAVWLLEHL